MSFYKSLEQLSIKIEQKNILIVTGNINEIISSNSKYYKYKSENKEFLPLYEFIGKDSLEKKYDFIEFYSPSLGIKNFSGNAIEKVVHDEDFGEEDSSTTPPLSQYIMQINDRFALSREMKETKSSIYIIDCSEVFFDKSGNGIDPAVLAQLLSNFITDIKSRFIPYIEQKKKLVLLTRIPEGITNLIPGNNLEFASVHLSKPNNEERAEFFMVNGPNLPIKNTINDENHHDFTEAVSISDSLSFREIIQFARIEYADTNMSFKELYALATFNKKDSEWEKLDEERLSKINEILNDRVKGQEHAINLVKQTLIRSFTGMSGITHSINNKKPKGALFLSGPTGTGKTELAKAISEFVFGDESRIIRFDMSEYNHEHSDQRLIGSPPGYVGYDAGGQLTNSVKEKPFSILLFDEIEKAHGKILDKFLQILEDGRLTSSQGELIDFSETFIIFTSNIGSSEINDEGPEQNELARLKFKNAVKKHFIETLGRPEILNRIGEKNIVPFNFINNQSIQNEIIKSKIDKIESNLLKEKFIKICKDEKTSEVLLDNISSKADTKYGGRGIITEIETYYMDELSNFMFQNWNIINKARINREYKEIKLMIVGKKINFSF